MFRKYISVIQIAIRSATVLKILKLDNTAWQEFPPALVRGINLARESNRHERSHTNLSFHHWAEWTTTKGAGYTETDDGNAVEMKSISCDLSSPSSVAIGVLFEKC